MTHAKGVWCLSKKQTPLGIPKDGCCIPNRMGSCPNYERLCMNINLLYILGPIMERRKVLYSFMLVYQNIFFYKDKVRHQKRGSTINPQNHS